MFLATEIETSTGVRFDLLKPRGYVGLDLDLAAGLSRIPRFCGQTAYSVAEHSIAVADRVDRGLAGSGIENGRRAMICLAALLHDAHEAFTGDLTRPAQKAIAAIDPAALLAFNRLREQVQIAIESWFDLPALSVAERERVKYADDRELMREAYWLLPSHGQGWELPPARRPGSPIVGIGPEEAADLFLKRLKKWS